MKTNSTVNSTFIIVGILEDFLNVYVPQACFVYAVFFLFFCYRWMRAFYLLEIDTGSQLNDNKVYRVSIAMSIAAAVTTAPVFVFLHKTVNV
jgi:hypothetical protein